LDELPRLVRHAWVQALGHENFTDDDYFFGVGGNSLLAIRVMATLSEELGVRLPLRLLFDHQTVTDLATALAASRS